MYVGAIGSPVVYYHSSLSHNIIDLNCTGNEDIVLDCPYNNLTEYSCSSSNDANIFCEGKIFNRTLHVKMIDLTFVAINVTNQSNCTDGDIQLVGGSNKYEGRIEVCINQAWGTVCGFSVLLTGTAEVVCRQIGALTLGNVSVQCCQLVTVDP